MSNFAKEVEQTIVNICTAHNGLDHVRIMHGDLHPDHSNHRDPTPWLYREYFDDVQHRFGDFIVSLSKLVEIAKKIDKLEDWKKANNIHLVKGVNSQNSKTL